MSRYIGVRINKFCEYCHREDINEFQFVAGRPRKPVRLHAMPDKTMICEQCRRTHGYKHQNPIKADHEFDSRLEALFNEIGG